MQSQAAKQVRAARNAAKQVRAARNAALHQRDASRWQARTKELQP